MEFEFRQMFGRDIANLREIHRKLTEARALADDLPPGTREVLALALVHVEGELGAAMAIWEGAQSGEGQ